MPAQSKMGAKQMATALSKRREMQNQLRNLRRRVVREMDNQHPAQMGTDGNHARMGGGEIHVQSGGPGHPAQLGREDQDCLVISDAGYHHVNSPTQVERSRDVSIFPQIK